MILSLAIGMAVCVAVFSVVNVMIFGTVPGISERQTLTHVTWSNHRGLFTPAEFELFEQQSLRSFTTIAAQGDRTVTLLLPSGPLSASAAFVSSEFFETLGTHAVRGRLLNRADARGHAAPAVVISESLWRGPLGGDPGILGRGVTANGRAYTVVGVAPERAPGLRALDVGSHESAYPQVWLRLHEAIKWTGGAGQNVPWLSVAGRLAQDRTVRGTRAEMAVIKPRLMDVAGSQLRANAFLRVWSAGVDWRTNPVDALGTFGLFMFLPLAVLAIGCVNVVNLQLARAVEQASDLSIRLALGASRYSLVRLLSTEVLMLATMAGGLGWMAGHAMVVRASTLLAIPIEVDGRVLALVVGLVVIVTAATGLMPAWISTRYAVAAGLRLRHGGGRVRTRTRLVLVALQLGVSLPLIALSGMAIHATVRQRPLLPSDAERILLTEFDLTDVRSTPPRPGLFVDAMLEHLVGEPSIDNVAFSTFAVFGNPIAYRGARDSPERQQYAFGGFVTSGWFDTNGVPFLAGRAPHQNSGATAEIAINATLARIMSAQYDAIGQELLVTAVRADPALTSLVVGVVVDTQRSADGYPVPMIFLPMPEEAFPRLVLTARARDRTSARDALHRAVAGADSAVPPGTVVTLEGRVDDMHRGFRGLAVVGLLLGSLALALAGLGLYALLAYTVRRRTREIGVRIAIGAQRRDILWLVLRQTAVLVLAGSACGLLIAVPMAALMRSVLVGVSPFEPLALIPAVLLLVLVSLIASTGPAVRASRIEPVHALRED